MPISMSVSSCQTIYVTDYDLQQPCKLANVVTQTVCEQMTCNPLSCCQQTRCLKIVTRKRTNKMSPQQRKVNAVIQD